MTRIAEIEAREKAALAEALEGFRQPSGHFVFCDTARGLGLGRCTPACEKARTLLANISPAAKAILEKAQAHDAMVAENERLRKFANQFVCERHKGSDQPCDRTECNVAWPMWCDEARAALKEPE